MRKIARGNGNVKSLESLDHLVEDAAPFHEISLRQFNLGNFRLSFLYGSPQVLRGDTEFYRNVPSEVFPVNERGSGAVMDIRHPGEGHNPSIREGRQGFC